MGKEEEREQIHRMADELIDDILQRQQKLAQDLHRVSTGHVIDYYSQRKYGEKHQGYQLLHQVLVAIKSGQRDEVANFLMATQVSPWQRWSFYRETSKFANYENKVIAIARSALDHFESEHKAQDYEHMQAKHIRPGK